MAYSQSARIFSSFHNYFSTNQPEKNMNHFEFASLSSRLDVIKCVLLQNKQQTLSISLKTWMKSYRLESALPTLVPHFNKYHHTTNRAWKQTVNQTCAQQTSSTTIHFLSESLVWMCVWCLSFNESWSLHFLKL